MVSGWITLAVGIRSGAEITRGFEKSRKYCNFYNGVKMISGWCTQAFGIRFGAKITRGCYLPAVHIRKFDVNFVKLSMIIKINLSTCV